MKLNQRQKLFCEYYVGECNGNAANAAMKAGYSYNYSYKQAFKLLENQVIADYIKQLNQHETNKNIATIEEIHAFWTAILNNENVAVRDRLKASELLAKCKGAFNNDW